VTLTKPIAHKSYRAGTLITVTFTVAEPGKAPGTGVPVGSVFQVQLTRNPGPPTKLVPAAVHDGRYSVAVRWPGGRLLRVGVGGFLTGASPTAAGGFWLPVTTASKSS
jgi:hypothetical protein